MPTADECKRFVEAVVNGDDKDSVPATRNRFARLYRDWFPPEPEDKYMVRYAVNSWSNAVGRWCPPLIEHQENPESFFEWQVAILRDRLRFIWLADQDTARYKIRMLPEHTLDFWGRRILEGSWVERRLATCKWLTSWLTARKGSRLLVCKNPECTDTKYFVRNTRQTHQRYCSPTCAAIADELRRLERRKQGRRRELSPIGLAAIREGQRKRRERERKEAGKRAKAGSEGEKGATCARGDRDCEQKRTSDGGTGRP